MSSDASVLGREPRLILDNVPDVSKGLLKTSEEGCPDNKGTEVHGEIGDGFLKALEQPFGPSIVRRFRQAVGHKSD